LEPKLDANGKAFVPDLKIVKVNGPSRLFELLKRASRNRVTAETNMNKRSSRSHSIFQLHLEGHNSITKETVQGLLNFIDLAGSEKLESSGVKGIQAKETIFINSSLTSLKDVFLALATNSKYVPYRHSKLTFVLQNSLSGNSKTMMFVNVSPAAENLQESINSLRFAANVNTCNLGTAKKTSKISFL
jgi:kinesin family protein C1